VIFSDGFITLIRYLSMYSRNILYTTIEYADTKPALGERVSINAIVQNNAKENTADINWVGAKGMFANSGKIRSALLSGFV
jgi:hypothetical protein